MTKTVAGLFSKERLYQEREKAILQVAGEVFMKKGPHGMSMDEIADLVGIGKPTVARKYNKVMQSLTHANSSTQSKHDLCGIG